MAKRKKKRTRIRTAAGTVQDQFIARMKELRRDLTQVLPDCPHGDPRPVARIRKKVEAMAATGKAGFFDRRDKGVVGAVANALPFADLESVPRIADHRILGKRRFFLQRGQVSQGCSVGVQNFDDRRVLLSAYRDLAKDEGLHFFADADHLWCTGDTAVPPDAWLASVYTCDLKAESEDRFGCGHREADRVLLGFHGGGPTIAVCAECARLDKNLHNRMSGRYAGPKQRKPFTVRHLDGHGDVHDLPEEAVAEYRAGVRNESSLVAEGLKAAPSHAEGHYMLGVEDFGTDQERFLDRLAPDGWERTALAVATSGGHAGSEATIEAVLQAHRERLPDAWHAVTGLPLQAPPSDDVRAWLRRGVDAAGRRRAAAALPDPGDVGPVGRFLDHIARVHRADGGPAATRAAHDAMTDPSVPDWQAGAALLALGANVPYTFNADEQDAAAQWQESVKTVLTADPGHYVAALHDHLARSGTGEV